MCIIVHRKPGHKISLDTLKQCQRENHDGWGIMSAQDGRVQTANGLDLDSFLKAYETFPEDQELAIHFRWKTHGAINLENTHPYKVWSIDDGYPKDLWVMHNGVISISQAGDYTMSDTWHWINKVCRPLLDRVPDLMNDERLVSILESTVDSSRLIFLDSDGHYFYLNEEKWVERWGCKFSTNPPSEYGNKKTYHWTGDYSQYWDNSTNANSRFYDPETKTFVSGSEKKGGTGTVITTPNTKPVDSFLKRNSALMLEYDPEEVTEDLFKGMSYAEVHEIVRSFPEDIASFLQKHFA